MAVGVNFPLPGAYGTNSQSDIADDQALRYASLASNGVVDQSGKLVSREDFVLQTAGFASTVEQVYTHSNDDGTETIMSAAVGKIYSGITALTQRVDNSATSTTLNNTCFASLTGKIYGCQKGIAPFVLNETTFAAEAFTGAPWTSSPNIFMAADGRMWAADDETGSIRYKVWWSNILDGKVWNAGDAGSLDVRRVWPKGQDSIIALAFLSSRLVIFGRSSILLYTLPADHNPASMSLTDSLEGIGCVARDSVKIAGGDLYFLSDSGVYKIPKLAQVTSLLSAVKVSPLVGDDLIACYTTQDMTKVRAGYSPRDKLYVLNAPDSNKTWVFHLDRNIPDINVPVVTSWTNTSEPFRAFAYDKSKNWYAGIANGIAKYTGYTPAGASTAYDFDFLTQWNAMQDETRLKILKNFALTIETAAAVTGTFKWRQDYKDGTTRTYSWTADAVDFAENPGIGVVRGPIGGSCSTGKFGFSVTMAGNKVTLHSLRIFASPGATKVR